MMCVGGTELDTPSVGPLHLPLQQHRRGVLMDLRATPRSEKILKNEHRITSPHITSHRTASVLAVVLSYCMYAHDHG